MPGHFDSIGFPVNRPEDLDHWGRVARAEGDQFDWINPRTGRRSRYVCWNAGNGCQLWVSIDRFGKIVGCDPHFAGKGRAFIGVQDYLPYAGTDDDGNPVDATDPPTGAVAAVVAENTPQQTKAGFDVHAYGRFFEHLDDLDRGTVQIAAFAHGCNCFADEQTYHAAQPPQMRFAVHSYLPLGLLDTSGEFPPSMARFSGVILSADRLKNPTTDREFNALLVQTLGMTVDIVADDEQLGGEPIVGGIVAGSFWMSAVPVRTVRTAAPKPEATITITAVEE